MSSAARNLKQSFSVDLNKNTLLEKKSDDESFRKPNLLLSRVSAKKKVGVFWRRQLAAGLAALKSRTKKTEEVPKPQSGNFGRRNLYYTPGIRISHTYYQLI